MDSGKRAWQGQQNGPAKRFNSGQGGYDEDEMAAEEDPGVLLGVCLRLQNMRVC